MRNIQTTIKNNLKVIENYSFTSALHICYAIIGLLMYPYLIRVLGSETYGLYIFTFSASLILRTFIDFALDLVGTKEIAQNLDNLQKKSEIVSSVVFTKSLLFIIVLMIFLLLSYFSPFITKHFLLYCVCFFENLSTILFHSWYFQGIQKMKIVTYIQVGFRLASLPFIVLFVNGENDVLLYAMIMLSSTLSASLYGFYYLLVKEKITIQWVGWSAIKHRLHISLPFFYTTLLGTLKTQIIPQIIGTSIGMHAVALFDLAQKILSLPNILLYSINQAIFPELAKSKQNDNVSNIIKYEYILGFFCMLAIAIMGKWAVLILGGKEMYDAYYVLLILNINIWSSLVIGGYLYLGFTLHNRNDLVTKNQLVSLVSTVIFIAIGLIFCQNIYMFAWALVLSGLVGVLYCHWNFKRI